jgi:hypothetical protein
MSEWRGMRGSELAIESGKQKEGEGINTGAWGGDGSGNGRGYSPLGVDQLPDSGEVMVVVFGDKA